MSTKLPDSAAHQTLALDGGWCDAEPRLNRWRHSQERRGDDPIWWLSETRFTEDPMIELVPLSPWRPTASAGVGQMIANRFEIALTERSTHDGQPLVVRAPVENKRDATVELGSARILLRYLPGRARSGGVDERFSLLMSVALIETKDNHWIRVVDAYNIRARRRPYGEGHIVVSHRRPQKLDLESLWAGLLVSRALGPEYTGFFNGIAPSRQTFHFQFLRERVPIWGALLDDRLPPAAESVLRLPNTTGQFSEVTLFTLDRWPFVATVLACKDVEALAAAVWEFVQPAPEAHDLIFRDCGDKPRVIAVRRRRAKPLALAKHGLDVYGDFGALEMAGLVVCFKDDAGDGGERLWNDLQRDPAPLAAAYAEVCGQPC